VAKGWPLNSCARCIAGEWHPDNCGTCMVKEVSLNRCGSCNISAWPLSIRDSYLVTELSPNSCGRCMVSEWPLNSCGGCMASQWPYCSCVRLLAGRWPLNSCAGYMARLHSKYQLQYYPRGWPCLYMAITVRCGWWMPRVVLEQLSQLYDRLDKYFRAGFYYNESILVRDLKIPTSNCQRPSLTRIKGYRSLLL